MRDTKHLEKFAKEREQKEKEKKLFKNKIKAVEAGAHGTLEYTIKEGTNKDKIAENPVKTMGTRNDYKGEKFFEFSKKMIGKGATILGGCCDTTPFHINEISKLK